MLFARSKLNTVNIKNTEPAKDLISLEHSRIFIEKHVSKQGTTVHTSYQAHTINKTALLFTRIKVTQGNLTFDVINGKQ